MKRVEMVVYHAVLSVRGPAHLREDLVDLLRASVAEGLALDGGVLELLQLRYTGASPDGTMDLPVVRTGDPAGR